MNGQATCITDNPILFNIYAMFFFDNLLLIW